MKKWPSAEALLGTTPKRKPVEASLWGTSPEHKKQFNLMPQPIKKT